MPQSFALEELFSGLIQAFGGTRPTSGGLGELYDALIAAVQASGGGTQGHQGSQGAQGTAGTQGPQGAQGGAQGFQGAQGSTGSQGAQGSGGQGAQGSQGSQGVTGTTGNQGAQGVSGAQGHQGFQGTQGTQGTTGAQGNAGTQGTTGAQGNQGFQGTAGGAQGSQGAQGTAGSQGAQGTQGAGSQGAQGAQGSAGTQGAQGSQGAGGAWTLIASNVLGSPAASFDFTSIAGSYHHLVVVVDAVSSRAAESDNFAVQLNADTAADYRAVGTTNDGSTLAAHSGIVSAMAADIPDMPAGSAFNHVTGGLEIWIQNYTDTNNYKNILWRSGFADSLHSAYAQTAYVFMVELLSAISEVKVFPVTGPNFTTGSAAYLYGVT